MNVNLRSTYGANVGERVGDRVLFEKHKSITIRVRLVSTDIYQPNIVKNFTYGEKVGDWHGAEKVWYGLVRFDFM